MAEHVRARYDSALHACNAVDFDDLILLTLNGTKYPPGDDTWSYVPPADGGPAIRFLGSLCTTIESSTAQNPVQLDLRILRVL